MNEKIKEMTTGRALVGFFCPIALMILLILIGADMTIGMIAALFRLSLYAIYMGHSWEEIEKSMSGGGAQIGTSAAVMLFVGCMVAVWIACGTIPTLLYYGLQIISPKWFLPICFILPAFMAVCTGTSWGAVSTIGVVLCGMASGLGINIGLAAGAVISGAYFGDKMSPLSDTTLLAAASTEVSVFEHIASMMYTTVPTTVICLVIYTVLGLSASGNIDTAAIAEMTGGMAANFKISVLNLLPILIVLVMSVKRVPALLTFGAGIGSAMIWAMVYQGVSFTALLGNLMSGFSIDTGIASVNTLLNRGGLNGMLGLIGIMIFCGMFSGLLGDLKVTHKLVETILKKVHTPFGMLTGAMISARLLCGAGGQYPAITITAVAFKNMTDDLDIHRGVLSRTLEDVGTVISPLIFWNAWTIGLGTVLGITVFDFMPFTFFSILNPFVALVVNYLGIGLYHRNDEMKYRPMWRRKKTVAE
jgi:NhaC family Na+:H+ antiporter